MDFDPRRMVRFVAATSLALITLAATLQAGIGFGNRRSVGGVIIDSSGIVRTATLQDQQELADVIRQGLDPVQGDLREATEMRMISLRGLQEEILKSHESGATIPDEVEFLAGLQRIEFVFVDQQRNDIILAGPAEPWKLRDDGFVVGTESGGATMRLADLAVALQSVESARQGGISCSIEPTPEGRRRLQQLLRRIKLKPGQNPAIFEASMREAFGPQMIQLNGIPTDSRFARTLVAADFEMKRVAMGLTESPVDELPSYLQMSRNTRHASNQNPRWWMACDYSSLGRSEDGLAWKLTGSGVKTMTEQDVVSADGSVRGAGVTDKVAQQWADRMNSHYDELSKQMPVFADLRNLMDLTVVATLIVQEGLAEKANLDLSTLAGRGESLPLSSYNVPKMVEPQCSFIRGRSGWVVTASGGVDINAFDVVTRQSVDESVTQAKTDAVAAVADRWWWNR